MADAGAMGDMATITDLLKGLSDASGVFSSGFSGKAQGQFESGQYAFNAAISDMLAEEAIRIGNKKAGQVKIMARRLIGSQRAAYAGQGVDVSTGSAAEVQEDTVRLSTMDALEIQNNAWKEAWGYRVQAVQQRGAAEFTRIQTESAFNQSIITGGLQAANSVLGAAKSFYGV